MTLEAVQAWFASHGPSLLRATLEALVAIALSGPVSRGVARVLERTGKAAFADLARTLVRWAIVVIGITTALQQVGFDLSVLLGAAGVLTVAIGFASQTSASNLISGLFLLAEGAISVGDNVKIGALRGEVLSIDLLSVKLRTFDNLLVRIPNETVVKAEVTNLTKFPIRRADIMVSVAYGTDLRKARTVLEAVAAEHPDALHDPPLFYAVEELGESGVVLQFSVWFPREVFFEAKTELYVRITEAFARAGISIPFPQRMVHLAPAHSTETT